MSHYNYTYLGTLCIVATYLDTSIANNLLNPRGRPIKSGSYWRSTFLITLYKANGSMTILWLWQLGVLEHTSFLMIMYGDIDVLIWIWLWHFEMYVFLTSYMLVFCNENVKYVYIDPVFFEKCVLGCP